LFAAILREHRERKRDAQREEGREENSIHPTRHELSFCVRAHNSRLTARIVVLC